MRLAGFEEKGVTCFDRRCALRVPRLSRARDDVIELPLRAVRMERIWDLSRGDAQDFHIEGMALVQVGGPRIASQCLGDSLAEPGKFSLRGFRRFLRDVTGIDFFHDGYQRISHHKHALCPNSFMLWTRHTSLLKAFLEETYEQKPARCSSKSREGWAGRC